MRKYPELRCLENGCHGHSGGATSNYKRTLAGHQMEFPIRNSGRQRHSVSYKLQRRWPRQPQNNEGFYLEGYQNGVWNTKMPRIILIDLSTEDGNNIMMPCLLWLEYMHAGG
jgi:hypothetical protein